MPPLSCVLYVSLFPSLPLPLWSTSIQQILVARSFFPFFPSLPSRSRTINVLSPRQIGEAYAPQTCHIPTPLFETLEINHAEIGGQRYHPPGGQCTEANLRVVLRGTTTTRNLGAFSFNIYVHGRLQWPVSTRTTRPRRSHTPGMGIAYDSGSTIIARKLS